MKEKSWGCTLITQLSLCMLVYIALNIGQPQDLAYKESSPSDIYFISVAEGFRPFAQQTLLLQQMAKVKKMYKPRFVIGFSELGGSDPLLHNLLGEEIKKFTLCQVDTILGKCKFVWDGPICKYASVFPVLRNMPWYTVGALEGQGQTYFLKTIKNPRGQSLDIIALDTVSLQDQSSRHGNDQIVWLQRTLNESKSGWKIVVGLHQLITIERLHNILLQYEVDAYMSMQTNVGGGGMHITPINHNLIPKEEIVDGFLLHQISSLEMVNLVVKVRGGVEHRSTFGHKGRAAAM